MKVVKDFLGLTPKLTEDESDAAKTRDAKLIVYPSSKVALFIPNDKIPGQSWKSFDVFSKGLRLDQNAINYQFTIFKAVCDVTMGEMGRRTQQKKETKMERQTDEYGLEVEQRTEERYEQQEEFMLKCAISLPRFYRFFDVKESAFATRVLQYFDNDSNGAVDFEEFVCSLWNLCSFEASELYRFVFSLYDEDRSESLTYEEGKKLVADVFSAKRSKDICELLVRQLECYATPGIYANEWEVSLQRFKEYCDSFPEVLEPIVLLQRYLQKRIMGEEWWLHIASPMRKEIMAELSDFLRDYLKPTGAEESEREVMNSVFSQKLSPQHAKHRRDGIASQQFGKGSRNGIITYDNFGEETDTAVQGLQREISELAGLECLPSPVSDARARVIGRAGSSVAAQKQEVAAYRMSLLDSLKTKREEYLKGHLEKLRVLEARNDPVIELLLFENRSCFKLILEEILQEWIDTRSSICQKIYVPQLQGSDRKREAVIEKQTSRCTSPTKRLPEVERRALQRQIRGRIESTQLLHRTTPTQVIEPRFRPEYDPLLTSATRNAGKARSEVEDVLFTTEGQREHVRQLVFSSTDKLASLYRTSKAHR